MPNYCSLEDAKDIAGNASGVSVEDWWLDAVDDMIERWTGQGYKGATRVLTHRGSGNSLIKLPSKAAAITSVTEEGIALPTSDYILENNGRYLERTANALYLFHYDPPYVGCWYRGVKYLITYTEPAITVLPDEYRFAAANCVAIVAMFAKKHKEFGIALTAQDAGSAGRVSTASSTSFPASLVEELRRTIKAALPRGSI